MLGLILEIQILKVSRLSSDWKTTKLLMFQDLRDLKMNSRKKRLE